ncbi:MAG: TetR/AcrR family transcriptional regulator C-terminal domain-containing protein [Lachnospiraceae bacterium]|nr:TetR/AcrR family transcriptional regulator C-terminal domain-containing protein [Lachnospiraceae bacterium]
MQSKTQIESRLKDAFKALALEEPVEKITIQQIAERAGVIRTTFYNHFQDKYDLMEYIIREDIVEPIGSLIDNDMIDEAVVLIFSNLMREKELYQRLAKTSGQNSFEEIVQKCVNDLLYQVIAKKIQARIDTKSLKHIWLSPEMVSMYYSKTMSFIVMYWIELGMPYSPRELGVIYEYIISHSLQDVVDELQDDAQGGMQGGAS